jgi:AraC-like DNA-binding protein
MSDQKIDIRDERTLLKTKGAHRDTESGSVIISLPGDGNRDGEIQTYALADGFYLMNIDIRSTSIPNASADPDWERVLIINYCFQGRCEVPLDDGRYIYLSEGELAMDIDRLKSDFYYPDAEYEGLELLIRLDDDRAESFKVLGEEFRAPKTLYKRVVQSAPPCIYCVNALLARIMSDLRAHMHRREDRGIVAMKTTEWLMMLARHWDWLQRINKPVYSQSQVTIAKAVQGILMADLSKRYTARELARRFDVSETSLKTYFKYVYGCGYAAYQHNQRMKRAAKLLAETSKKVSEIATSVGYVSQAKFGKRFKETYGLTPLEYRRAEKLKLRQNTGGGV